ncbi:MAG: FtsH protease activity modulator HflK [Pseudomonadota bacterium]|nr:FtsH protease activity modulator HflK [Pseudomonadota bacterium]
MSLPDGLRRAGSVVALIVGLGVLASSVMVVDPAEVAVVYRFGAVDRVLGAGLGFRLPLVERAERIRVTEVRRIELPRRRLLTEDTNLVELEIVAQFSVSDPVLFALVHEDPEKVVAAEVESALNARVADVAVDALLTTGRAELQQALMDAAQKSLDALATGVRLVAVDVRDLVPPVAVVNAFNDVSSAKGDQETMRLAADSYASKVLPEVRGRAAQLEQEALAAAAEQSARADGDIARFFALLPAWRSDPAATRIQLRAELWDRIGSRAQVMLVPPGSEVTVPAGTANRVGSPQ